MASMKKATTSEELVKAMISKSRSSKVLQGSGTVSCTAGSASGGVGLSKDYGIERSLPYLLHLYDKGRVLSSMPLLYVKEGCSDEALSPQSAGGTFYVVKSRFI